jgi:hypothetical protein
VTTLSQALPATLQSNTTYTLSALIGQVPTYLFNYAIQLWAGNTLLATSSRLMASPSFVSATDTLSYFSGANPPQAGQNLTIVIAATGTAQGNSGVFFDNIALTASTVTTIASAISASGFGAFASASPGSWVEIYGANLAVDTRSWALSDFSGINAPTSLDGTKVTIGGKPAFVDYISPGQVNVLLPSDTPTGNQQLSVTSPMGTASFGIAINQSPGPPHVPGFQYQRRSLCRGDVHGWRVCPTRGSDSGRQFQTGKTGRCHHSLWDRVWTRHAFHSCGAVGAAAQCALASLDHIHRRNPREHRL